jgi:hypothetical protein
MSLVSRRPVLALVAALVALLALAPAGADARRKVPQQFMGVNFDSAIATAPTDIWSAQFPRMAAAGVESIRAAFYWAEGEPTQDGPINYESTDRIVAAAATRGLRVMPTFILAPEWARRSPAKPFSPATNPKWMRRYVHALVNRYGSKGSFWRTYTTLPRLPIREWQFWNEPQFQEFWTIPHDEWWARSYVKHLKVFHKAVRERDRKARVVLAGLTNKSWDRLREVYSAGGKRAFEVAAVHPFTAKPAGVVEIVRRMRTVMRKHKDRRTPLFVTEFGKPASKGHVKDPTDRNLETTPSGMAKFLSSTYAKLAAARRKLRVTRAYWYTWASEYEAKRDIFRFAGLFQYRDGMSGTVEKPAYRSYVRSARRLEGCKKGRSGHCR